MDNLGDIRTRIEALDAELMDLIAERVSLAADAGAIKRSQGLGPRDFVVERSVVDRYRTGFETRELEPTAGERIANELFTETLRVQEDAARSTATETTGSVLIVGGAGQMGTWFADYLDGIGHEVTIHDPAGSPPGFQVAEQLRPAAVAADWVLISVPPDTVGTVLRSLEGIETPIVDVASLKSPFIDELERLGSVQPIASAHPMWGPGTRVLSDKYVLLCDCGHADGLEAARLLLEPTLATVVEVPLDSHDEAMAFTQLLPQAVSLLCAEVLSRAPFTIEELDERGGGSFSRQMTVTEEIVHRDPQLYRQIQALNQHAPALYDRLEQALEQLRRDRLDPDAFEDAMRRYRHLFNGTVEERHP